MTGTDAGNYALQNTTATTSADITRAPLALAASSDSKTYDGGTVSTLTPTVSGLLGSDSVSAAAQAFASKNVLGTGASTLAVTGYTVNDGNGGGNYSVSTQTASGTITPAALAINAVSASKVYDGSTTSAAVPSVSGLLGSDSVSNAREAYASKNVRGNGGSSLSVTGYTVNDGNSGANYTVSTTTASGTITAAPLTVAAVSDSKVYDATVSSAATPTVAGMLGTDTLVSATQAFVSKLVLGTANSTLSVTGYSLNDGNAGANYQVHTTTAAGTISPAPLTVSGPSAVNRVYDGTSAVGLTGQASVRPLLTDAVGVGGGGQGRLADKNAGVARAVAVTGYTLTGPDAGNYTVVQPLGLTATISPAPLPITGITALDKVYDGSTAVQLRGTGSVAALSGDAVSVAGSGVGEFADKSVGMAKAVSVSGFTLSGTDAANYSPVQPANLSAAITPALLTYVATPTTVFLGQPIVGLTGAVSGLVQGDTFATATTGTVSWSSAATSASPQGSYAVEGSGLSAQNYRFAQAAGNATALTIQPGTVPQTVTDISAQLASLYTPANVDPLNEPASRRRVTPVSLPGQLRRGPWQVVGAGVNLPANAFGETP